MCAVRAQDSRIVMLNFKINKYIFFLFLVTDESVHVEHPVEGVDLDEGGDVDREAAVWENHSEHVLLCLLCFVFCSLLSFLCCISGVFCFVCVVCEKIRW